MHDDEDRVGTDSVRLYRVAEVAAGRGDVLLGMRDSYMGRGPDGRCNDLLDATVAIRCMDNPRRTPAENTELARGIYAAAPFLDAGRPVAESRRRLQLAEVRPGDGSTSSSTSPVRRVITSSRSTCGTWRTARPEGARSRSTGTVSRGLAVSLALTLRSRWVLGG